MNSKDMATRIRDLRAEKHLTLKQVAEVVGVGFSTVRKWETGMIDNMRRDKIAKLAIALGTSPAYLMGWTDDKNPDVESHEIPDAYFRLSWENRKLVDDLIESLSKNK